MVLTLWRNCLVDSGRLAVGNIGDHVGYNGYIGQASPLTSTTNYSERMTTHGTTSRNETLWYQVLLERAFSILQIRPVFTSLPVRLRGFLGTTIICLLPVLELTRRLSSVTERPKMKAFASHALRLRSILLLATVAAFVPAIALNWMWWYVRRHCTQAISRIVL